nr:vacuolar protein sorting-associated protein 41 homolog [Tanacetum cinerariifolium]
MCSRGPEMLMVEALSPNPLISYGLHTLQMTTGSDMRNSSNLVAAWNKLMRTITKKEELIRAYRAIPSFRDFTTRTAGGYLMYLVGPSPLVILMVVKVVSQCNLSIHLAYNRGSLVSSCLGLIGGAASTPYQCSVVSSPLLMARTTSLPLGYSNKNNANKPTTLAFMYSRSVTVNILSQYLKPLLHSIVVVVQLVNKINTWVIVKIILHSRHRISLSVFGFLSFLLDPFSMNKGFLDVVSLSSLEEVVLQLPVLVPYIPTEGLVLRDTAYEVAPVAVATILSFHKDLLFDVKSWPPAIYSALPVIAAIELQLTTCELPERLRLTYRPEEDIVSHPDIGENTGLMHRGQMRVVRSSLTF